MKRLLALALFGTLASTSASADDSTGSSLGDLRYRIRPGDLAQSRPVSNPESITLVALAGGAAVAGGLLRRTKDAKT